VHGSTTVSTSFPAGLTMVLLLLVALLWVPSLFTPNGFDNQTVSRSLQVLMDVT
jgi:hypothetical protein